MSQSIVVLGLGNWGTALANHLAIKGFSVIGWTIEEDIVEGINSNNFNPKYLSDVKLSSNLKATNDINLPKDALLYLLAVPSAALTHIRKVIEKIPSEAIIVSAVKGLEPQNQKTPLEFLEEFKDKSFNITVLSGPSFAKDLVLQRPLGIVSASTDKEVAKKVAETLSSPTLKVYVSQDPLGVELGGILKNVIAIAAGVSDGLGFGDSARAGLITRGLAEMKRLARAMGADERTLSGLSGLGDLAMTASSDLSRNRTVGLRLGKGEKLDIIVSSLGSVAEGVGTARHVLKLAEKYNVDMPISKSVCSLIDGKINLEEMAKGLLSRPVRDELE